MLCVHIRWLHLSTVSRRWKQNFQKILMNNVWRLGTSTSLKLSTLAVIKTMKNLLQLHIWIPFETIKDEIIELALNLQRIRWWGWTENHELNLNWMEFFRNFFESRPTVIIKYLKMFFFNVFLVVYQNLKKS